MKIKAKYAGKCARCDGWIAIGETVEWDSDARTVLHLACVTDHESTKQSPVQLVQKGVTARYNPPAMQHPQNRGINRKRGPQ